MKTEIDSMMTKIDKKYTIMENRSNNLSLSLFFLVAWCFIDNIVRGDQMILKSSTGG